jgi:hypothetical protein
MHWGTFKYFLQEVTKEFIQNFIYTNTHIYKVFQLARNIFKQKKL